ncbi:hypothetical protein ACFLZW_03640 [Chloroflexota bacterium]
MKTNGDCVLPCFWGIVPGKSLWQDVQSSMGYLDLLVRDYPGKAGVIHATTFNLEDDLRNSLSFYEQNGVVQVINFSVKDPTRYAPYYELRNIMEHLGAPAYVAIDLLIGGPGGTPDVAKYYLIIHYGETQNGPWVKMPWVRLNYGGRALKIGNRYRFCPTDLHFEAIGYETPRLTSEGLVLHLQSLESPMTIEELSTAFGKSYYSMPPDIEKSAGVSVQEFYRKIMESDEPACFDTPINFWPG